MCTVTQKLARLYVDDYTKITSHERLQGSHLVASALAVPTYLKNNLPITQELFRSIVPDRQLRIFKSIEKNEDTGVFEANLGMKYYHYKKFNIGLTIALLATATGLVAWKLFQKPNQFDEKVGIPIVFPMLKRFGFSI